MSIACLEARVPPAVRIERALRIAAEELTVASLDDVIALASELCQMQVWPQTALRFFTREYDSFQVTEVGERVLIRVRSPIPAA
jgi:hypothetical protein